MNDKDLDRAYFLMRVISRAKIPFWLENKRGIEYLFEYPVGTVEKWKKELDALLEKDKTERPYEFRSGEN
jgi:hypothetical protein